MTHPHGEPQYQRDASTFNGKPYVLFSAAEEDALEYRPTPPTSWSGHHSLFIVVEQTGAMVKNASYFSSGVGADTGTAFQVGCVTGGGCTTTPYEVALKPPNSGVTFRTNSAGVDETRIYTIRNDDGSSSDQTETYLDGVHTNSQSARTFNFDRYLIGLNRAAKKWNNFRLAELVLYDRALDKSELSDVHEYLATKYGISSEAAGYAVGRLSWEQLFPSQ